MAAPIEQQVLGAEGLVHTFSRSAVDGTYVLHVMFQRGVDLNVAQALVQNRASLALPILPDPVKRAGLTVKKKSPGPLMLAILFSPDASHDALFLANYATILIRDELVRVPGVAGVALFGADDSGRVVRSNGVASVELGGVGRWPYARLDGKPAVALALFPILEARPREVGAAISRKLSELRSRFPPDIDLCTRFEFTANPKAPDASAPPWVPPCGGELAVRRVARADPLDSRSLPGSLQGTEGVQNVLELSESPFGFRGISPCLVLRLSHARRETNWPGGSCEHYPRSPPSHRRRDISPVRFVEPEWLSAGRFSHRLGHFWPRGRAGAGGRAATHRATATGREADRRGLGPSIRFSAAVVCGHRPHQSGDAGRAIGNVFDTLQVFLGSLYVGHFNSLGHVPDIRHLKVRNRHGEMIPLEMLL